jgi:hypothetical protein
MVKRKAQLLLCVSTSIFSKSAVCNGRRDGAQGVSRELCGVALDAHPQKKRQRRFKSSDASGSSGPEKALSQKESGALFFDQHIACRLPPLLPSLPLSYQPAPLRARHSASFWRISQTKPRFFSQKAKKRADFLRSARFFISFS